MRKCGMQSVATFGASLVVAGVVAATPAAAGFKDTYSRADATPAQDSLGSTEGGAGWSSMDYRELEASGGFPATVDVARMNAGRLVVTGRPGTSHPAFAVINAAGADPSFEIEARFLINDLTSGLVANSMALLLRNSGTAADGTISTAGLLLVELHVDGFFMIRGVVTEGVDPVYFATGFVDPLVLHAADLDGDGRLESGEPFRLGVHLEGPWLTFSFNGANQVRDLHLAGLPVPPAAGETVLFGRSRISTSRPYWAGVAFDDLRFGSAAELDQDQDGVASDQDCNDNDPTVHPGADEACNGVDDDCDGVVPAEERDGDGDGVRACDGDCNDAEPRVRPGALELPGDAVDENCDGIVVCDLSAPWRSHGEYVHCVRDAVNDLRRAGLITREEAERLKAEAARSDVGHQRDHRDGRSHGDRNRDGRSDRDRDQDGRSDRDGDCNRDQRNGKGNSRK